MQARQFIEDTGLACGGWSVGRYPVARIFHGGKAAGGVVRQIDLPAAEVRDPGEPAAGIGEGQELPRRTFASDESSAVGRVEAVDDAFGVGEAGEGAAAGGVVFPFILRKDEGRTRNIACRSERTPLLITAPLGGDIELR